MGREMSIVSFLSAVSSQAREGWSKAQKSPLLCCIIAAALTVAACGLLVLNSDYSGPDDDLGIAMALSGLYPESGLCLFVNALLAKIIFFMNSTFPSLNWFLIIERSPTAASFFALTYLMLRHVPFHVSVPVLGVIAYFILPECIIGANFTVVAALCIAAGEMCFFVALVKRSLGAGTAGLFLVFVGYMWRGLMLLLSTPFLALAFIALLVRCRSKMIGETKKLLARTVAAVLCVGIAVGGAFAYDQIAWAQPGWEDWKEFNDARYPLVDYPMKDYEEVAAELDAIGVTRSEYWLMTHWVTADPDFFTAEKMQQVGEIACETAGDRSLAAAFAEEGIRLVKSILFTCCLMGIAIVVGATGGRRAAIIAGFSMVGAFLACVVFRYTGRLPLRVEYSVWLYSLLPCVMAVLSLGEPSFGGDGRRKLNASGKLSLCLGVLITLFCCGSLVVKWAPLFDASRIDQFDSQSHRVEGNALVKTFTEPGTVFVWDATSFAQIEVELQYHYLPPASFMDSTVMAGGWTQGSPFLRAHNEKLGVPNPLKALIDRPDTFFVTRRKDAIENVLEHLRQRYDSNASYEIVDRVALPDKEKDPLLVVRFSSQ